MLTQQERRDSFMACIYSWTTFIGQHQPIRKHLRLVLMVTFLKCESHFNWESKTTPRYFNLFSFSVSSSLIVIVKPSHSFRHIETVFAQFRVRKLFRSHCEMINIWVKS